MGVEEKLNGNYLRLFIINYPLDTDLLLTSNNFHSIFSPFPLIPLLPVLSLVSLLKTVTCLYSVFTYIHHLLIEKDLHEWQNISVKFAYVYLYLSCRVPTLATRLFHYNICLRDKLSVIHFTIIALIIFILEIKSENQNIKYVKNI